MKFAPEEYLDFNETDHTGLFVDVTNVWEALPKIQEYIAAKVAAVPRTDRIQGQVHPQANLGEQVFVAEGAVVEAFATIKGPAWIGAESLVRSGAYVRENVIVGDYCTLGNSSEFKNCILFNRCEVPHFNYVGDSLLGFKAHLGAGVICSNVRLDRTQVKLRLPSGESLDTGLRKFGAVVGDHTEIGCNSVLSPGSILGKQCIVYPVTSWTGILPDRRIVKNRAMIDIVERH